MLLVRNLTIQCFCNGKEIQQTLINQNQHDMCVHIKPEVKKNDTTAMTTATNEACIG